MSARADLVRRFYQALARGERAKIEAMLHPDFVGRLAEGMPHGVGGVHRGPAAMLRHGWGGIARRFAARAEPERLLDLSDGGLLVIGRYRGRGRGNGSTLDANFAHLIAFEGERIVALEQFTDTARWQEASDSMTTVSLDVAGGVATLRLNRPDHGNAIDAQMAADLAAAARRLTEQPGLRAVLILANGAHFSLGGDISLFAGSDRAQLPHLLRRMIDDFHFAIERLTSIDAPVVAAVRGGVGGGGMGILYCADIVIAADDARFAMGYGALGLTADGGNTWFLPRLVGLRRAQELFLMNRRIKADEALALGLVTRLAPSAEVDAEAAKAAETLAAGPTRAFGAVRRLLRQTFETGLADQLAGEKRSIVEAAQTADAAEGIAAFKAKRSPQFRGE